MNQSDIPSGMSLKGAAGWNQLENDWKLFLESSTDGSMVAEYQEKIVGTVTTVNYSGHFSWIGMVLVDPEFRRMGIGTTLLKEAIKRATGQGTIRLDATPKGKMLYDTLGFEDEYGLNRYENKGFKRRASPESHLSCSPMVADDVIRIAAYDAQVFGAPREGILQSLYHMGRQYAWILREDSEIQGYCLGRSGSNFEQIGPVIASNTQGAVSLLHHALGNCIGKPVIIDIPDRQKSLRAYMERIGFRIQRPFIRMFLGDHLHRGLPEQQYAIAGPEIG